MNDLQLNRSPLDFEGIERAKRYAQHSLIAAA